MKLHEMNTDQLADALAIMTPAAVAIMKDEKVVNGFKAVAMSENQTVIEMVSSIAEIAAPVLLKTHREDTYTILSAMTGKTVSEIRNQNGLTTIKEAKRCFDKDMLDFFKSAVSTNQE